VRRHYRREFETRLRGLFERDEPMRRPPGRRDRWASERGARSAPGSQRLRGAGPALAGGCYVVASPQFAASPLLRGTRATISLREALILQAVLNHPWLLHEHLEDIAGVEFRHPEAEKVKAALIDIIAHANAPDREAVAGELDRRGLANLLARIESSITVPSVWGARPGAAPADVLMTWKQLIALHRQWHSLTKELKDAELALGRDSTEASYSWLQDIKTRLSALDGTEALIEGFGASSGRAGPAL
jgi:DNA primase